MGRRAALRLGLVAALPLLLAACGLRPLYDGAAGGQLARELAAIAVETPETRLGWLLGERLRAELAPRGSAPTRYRLTVALQSRKQPLAIQLDDSITRFELALSARYVLRDVRGQEVLHQGVLRRVASFNVVVSPFATLVAEQDAQRRAAAELAQAIRTQLALYFRGREP